MTRVNSTDSTGFGFLCFIFICFFIIFFRFYYSGMGHQTMVSIDGVIVLKRFLNKKMTIALTFSSGQETANLTVRDIEVVV